MNGSNINYSSIYAFVKFYSPRAARKAKESIGGKHLLDGQFLKVSFAVPSRVARTRGESSAIIPPLIT